MEKILMLMFVFFDADMVRKGVGTVWLEVWLCLAPKPQSTPLLPSGNKFNLNVINFSTALS
jgi:hypothetical protein